MDLVGKQLFKGTVEKQFQKISGESSGCSDIFEDENDNLSHEERRQLHIQNMERRKELKKDQDQRRAERAMAREEIRKKHNIKPNENDQQILKESKALPWVNTEDEDTGFFSSLSNKLKTAWDSITK